MLLTMLALPAADVSENVVAPKLMIDAVAAVAPFWKKMKPKLLPMLALPALAVSNVRIRPCVVIDGALEELLTIPAPVKVKSLTIEKE